MPGSLRNGAVEAKVEIHTMARAEMPQRPREENHRVGITHSKYFLSLAMTAMTALGQGQIEPRAGTWKTWILSSGRELRAAPPGDAAATADEISWLKDFMAEAGSNERGQVAFWDTGSPGMRWLELVEERILDGRIALPNAVRPLTLLNVAIYDATVAAWDSKYTYNRARPSERDPRIIPLLPVPASPSYPSEHAVAAGAAEAVLSALYPAEATLYHNMAEEAGRSRLYAGVHYPSDVIAGLELGRAVGRKVMEYAATDGFTTPWAGTVPTGPGLWVGTNPFFANAPGWKPFVLARASELRPGPPPAHTSAQTQAELAELKVGPQPFLNQAKALFWQTPEGNFTWFFDQITRRLFEYRLDGNAPRSARAYALMAVTMWDMFLASHDAKMTYWRIRPSQLDSTVPLLFPPPNHPSYPANHGMSAARANLLGYLFPAEAEYYRRLGEEIGLSRMWAGIHYRSDIVAAWEMAQQLLAKVIVRADSDGSKQ
jgi:membrane-associated phospholipid phosphatase